MAVLGTVSGLVKFDIFKDAEKLAQQSTSPDASGRFQRVTILRTKMKYPLVRVEETVQLEGHLGQERVLKQTAAVADHVMVKVRPGLAADAAARVARQLGGSIRKKLASQDTYLIGIRANEIDSLPKAIDALASEKALVAYAEPDYVVHTLTTPNDAAYSQLWGMNNTGQTGGTGDADIDAPEAWSVVTGSPSVVVGVIDTGVDYNHPDLAANIWTNPGEIPGNGLDDDGDGYVDDVHGWNFVAETNDPNDDYFHGTHCAGTIGAVGNNSTGVTGVNWQVKMIPLKFLSSSGGGVLSDAVDAVRYATRVGAKLTSNSWGGGGYSQSLKDAIDDAGTAGLLFVAAAGNDSSDNDAYPSYPASYACSNIISVAATDHADELAGFSNYGRTSVHIAAPGVGILSTFPTTMTPAMVTYNLPVGYARISGTSMATPHVAGAAALCLAQNPALTVAQLRALLLQRSDRLPTLDGYVNRNARLNLFSAVNPGWQARAASLLVDSITFGDPSGNSDSIPNPGEMIELMPMVSNDGDITATGVTVQIVSGNSSVTVVTAGTIGVGDVTPSVPVGPAAPLRLQIAGNVADNTEVTLDLIIRWNGGLDKHVAYSFVVSQPRPHAEVVTNFAVGEMKADPVRDRVYVINKTDRRVLAIDTALGQVAAIGTLDGSPHINPPVETGTLQSGQMAISTDGTKLFVALTESKKIQVLGLPDLTTITTLPVDFEPESLACGVGGRLFVASTEFWAPIREIDPSNGQVLGSFLDHNGARFYMHTLLRTNRAGTRLFTGSTGVRVVGGPISILEYDIAQPGTPLLVDMHPLVMRYMEDYAVDEERRRIYSVHSGIYMSGIQITEMDTKQYGDFWMLAPAGSQQLTPGALAHLPADPVIYCASIDPYIGGVHKFRRSDGLNMSKVLLSTQADPIPPRGLVVTPNGNLVYVKARFTGNKTEGYGGYVYTLGIIGRNSFTVTNSEPPVSPANVSLSVVDFSDALGNNDTAPTPGETVTLRPLVTNTGGTAATNVSIEIAGNDPSKATVAGPASYAIGTVGFLQTAGGSGPFTIALSPSLVQGDTLTFTFTIRYDTGQVKTFNYTLVVRALVSTAEAAATTFQIGEILADRVRNTVYLIDKRNMRLLAFDANSAHIVKAVAFDGPHKTAGGFAPEPGHLAQSTDHSRLYVALKKSKMIEVFSLPDLTPLAIWSYAFEPNSLACDASGRLYVTTTAAAQKLVQIDTGTGQVLGNYGAAFDTNSLLRQNTAGTKIYGNLGKAIYEYDVSGAAPVQSAVFNTSVNNTPDFDIDETYQRIYLTNSSTSTGMIVFDMTGVAAEQTWSLNSPYGGSQCLLPGGTEVIGAAGYSHIRRFRRSDGFMLTEYNVANTVNRGVAITPNGRIVYVMRSFSGSSDSPSIDGYDYTVGIIGSSTVALDIPGELPIQLQGVAFTDPSPANNNGQANSGELVQLNPTLKNVSEFQVQNLAIQLISQDSAAVVLSPATQSLGNLNSYSTASVAALPFKVQLSGALQDRQQLNFILRVTYDGRTQDFPYSIFATSIAHGDVSVDFAPAELVSDRTRNLVYVVNKTQNKLLALDTENGNVAARAPLNGVMTVGQMALSTDGTRLYVPLNTSNKIEVFAVPSLESINTINVTFPPYCIAQGGDGNLYVSAGSQSGTSGKIRQLNALDGTVLGTFGTRNYYNAFLRTNLDAGELYIADNAATMDEYRTVDGGLPALVETLPYSLSSGNDYALDEINRRLLTTGGSVYGIQTYERDTNLRGSKWLLGDQAAAMAFLPGDNFVYCGSKSSISGYIRRFRRDNGQPLADFPLFKNVPSSVNSGAIMVRGLAITPNGRLLYAKNYLTGNVNTGVNGSLYWLGIVGRSTLTINTPNESPLVDAGADITTILSNPLKVAATINDDGPLAGVVTTWRVLNGPGSAVFASSGATATVNFSAAGTYTLQVSATDGSTTGSDELTVVVQPDKTRVSITATKPLAQEYGLKQGELTVSRTGGTTGSLAVGLTVNGTADPGSDYVAIPATVIIPDGHASVTIPVTPLPDSTTEADETVVASIVASGAYDPGVSTSATVTIRNKSFANWQADKLGSVAPELRLPDADPNHNGIVNRLEYAFGLDPLGSSRAGYPSGGMTDLIAGQKYLSLTFRRLVSRADVTYIVETTDDLGNWPMEPGGLELTATSNADGTETVVVRDTVPMANSNKRFMRLRVIVP